MFAYASLSRAKFLPHYYRPSTHGTQYQKQKHQQRHLQPPALLLCPQFRPAIGPMRKKPQRRPLRCEGNDDLKNLLALKLDEARSDRIARQGRLEKCVTGNAFE